MAVVKHGMARSPLYKRALARRFGVTQAQIHNIIRGKQRNQPA